MKHFSMLLILLVVDMVSAEPKLKLVTPMGDQYTLQNPTTITFKGNQLSLNNSLFAPFSSTEIILVDSGITSIKAPAIQPAYKILGALASYDVAGRALTNIRQGHVVLLRSGTSVKRVINWRN